MIHSGHVAYHPSLADLMTPIDNIHPHPDNPNNGDLDTIIESIETNGMYRPVYTQRSTAHIVAGNTTWAACKTLHATHIPVVWLDIDDTTADRILGADNWTARLALPDPAAELALLTRIHDTSSLLGTGKTEADLAALHHLTDTPLDTGDWTTITIHCPTHLRDTYHRLTGTHTNARSRFETLLHLAGWDGQ